MAIRLLIITQKVDLEDPVLGFFHGWIEEFSRRFDKVTVICLGKGEYHLPDNVKVLSLGKDEGVSRIIYLFRFYKYIWRERRNYDAVFVHMNQEYILLGALFWWFMGKRTMMWRNHPYGSFFTDFSVFLSDIVFCTSGYSYVARSKKARIMPVGINTSAFMGRGAKRTKNSVLILGRIAPVKKQEFIINALEILRQNGISFVASFIGDPLPKDLDYYNRIHKKVSDAGLQSLVSFARAVQITETPRIYNEFEVFVNATPSGSFDKTIFEAMACGTLPITSNKGLIGVIDQRFIFEEDNANGLAEKLKDIFALSDEQKNSYRLENRDIVVRDHSLVSLVDKVKSSC